MIIALLGLLSTIGLASCDKELIEYGQGDVKVCIEQGREWLHNFPVFLGLKKKKPPQIAVWLEDMQGNYLFYGICFTQDCDTGLADGKRQPQKRSVAALVLFPWDNL